MRDHANLRVLVNWQADDDADTERWVYLRNIVLHSNLNVHAEAVVHDMQTHEITVTPPREFDDHSAVRDALSELLPIGLTQRFIGIVRYDDGAVLLWSPSGQPIENPGILEADLEGRGLVAALRIDAHGA